MQHEYNFEVNASNHVNKYFDHHARNPNKIFAPSPKTTVKISKSKFSKIKFELTKSEYLKINQIVFDNQLPEDLSVTWNKRLLTTAGITRSSYSDGSRRAVIELSEKVIDCEERLISTLLHEMCHAAGWLISGERNPPHGRAFWMWAGIAGSFSPSLSRCLPFELSPS